MKETMMENTPLFSVLTEEQRAIVAERMSLETRRAGAELYQQGRPATALYLIKSGWARLLTDQFAVLANLGAGSLLGDADVIAGRNYTTSAEAATDLTLWALGANDLKALMTDHPEIGQALKRALGVSEDQALERHLRRMALLAGLSSEQLHEVVGYLRPERFTAGQVIYRRGSKGETLYLVDEGRAQVAGPTGALATLSAGESFGEGGFLTGETHSTEATALTDVTLWSLSRSDFEELALRFPILALNLSRMVSRKLRERTLRAGATVQVIQPPAPAAPAVAAAEIGRAADSATSWWGARSRGAKFRLIAVTLLLLWLVFVSGSFAIRSLLSQADGVSLSNSVTKASVSERAVLVALAADLPVDVTPTFTPWPTETPIPTATFTPTATPTNTPTPTPTFTPTATPTNTPVPTATPIPTRAPVQAAAAVARAAAPAPAPAPTVKYKLIEMRRLDPCENRGMHNIFIKVVDAAGNPVDGVTVIQVPAGQPGNVLDKMVTGDKGPGKAEFIMWKKAEYGVYVSEDGVNPTSSDIAQPVHSNFADEAMCSDGGGGNTLFHNSFSLVFQKTS